MKTQVTTTTLVALFLLGACGNQEPEESSQSTSETTGENTSPVAAFFTDETIGAGELPVAKLRESQPEPGDTVQFEAKVMGRKQVFVPGASAFMVGDPTALTSCDEIPGDSCVTPWDVCCDDPEVIAKSIATVQLVDDEGKVIKQDIRDTDGLTELSMVQVEGVVAEGSGPDNLVVNASRIHVLP